MKNKLLSILLLVSSCCFGQTSVPNTETFSLQNVYDAVHNHTSGTSTNLQSCFDNAISTYFNATYNNNSYAPTNSMLRFRDYKPNSPCAITVSLNNQTDLYCPSLSHSFYCTDQSSTEYNCSLWASFADYPTCTRVSYGALDIQISSFSTGVQCYNTSCVAITNSGWYFIMYISGGFVQQIYVIQLTSGIITYLNKYYQIP